MNSWKKLLGVVLLGALIVCQLAAGDYFLRRLNLNKKDGIYKVGETVEVSATVTYKGRAAKTGTLRCNIKWEGKIIETRDFPCDGKKFTVSYKADKPGWVYFEFQMLGKNGKVIKNAGSPQQVRQRNKRSRLVAEIGAMYEPEKIRSTAPVPADFDEFWKNKRAELDKVPMNPVLKELESGTPDVKLYAVTVNCLGDRPVTAYLGVPANAKPKGHAAFVDFLSWSWCDASRRAAINQAKNGLIALAATWHGRNVGENKDYYAAEGKIFGREKLRIKDIGNPDKWFFAHTYFRVLRALDYIKSRPEWNGKDLMVQGGSLGGAQTTCAAAFDKDVTLAIIGVPCFCEFNAQVDGRKRSIPFGGWAKTSDADNKGASYFDVVNMAKNIKCEVFFSTGFVDELCPPSAVMAAYNNIPAGTKKHMYTNPRTGHYGTTRNVEGNDRIKKFIENVTVNQYPE